MSLDGSGLPRWKRRKARTLFDTQAVLTRFGGFFIAGLIGLKVPVHFL
jgi:hypothetical protein